MQLLLSSFLCCLTIFGAMTAAREFTSSFMVGSSYSSSHGRQSLPDPNQIIINDCRRRQQTIYSKSKFSRTRHQRSATNNSGGGGGGADLFTPRNVPRLARRAFLISSLLAGVQLVASQSLPSGFDRISPTQFIAALGDPKSKSGKNALEWGLWREDPGPRGVFLKDYDKLVGRYNYRAPAGWVFNQRDWWLEEHGLMMESPDFPMPPGTYIVTGGRWTTTELTVASDGSWSLKDGTLYDVTHLPCRSARYSPSPSAPDATPANARLSDFPVLPGATMPTVKGCDKVDYAVLFLIGRKTEIEEEEEARSTSEET